MPLGTAYLSDRDGFGAQVTGQARTIVTGAFDTDNDEPAESAGPRYELPVTGGGGHHAMSAQRAAEQINGMGDVELLVRVDTDSDLWLGGCGDGGFHCGPSCDRISGWGEGQIRRAGTILLRDAWSRSYQVTPSSGSAPNR